MSPTTHIIKEKLNPIPGRNEMRTKIWGVKCVTGLRYKQIGMKKYCITQAVLEPNPFMKDEGNFVSVMVVHNNGEEHLMAVLRHGQIYQVNLNMLFDRDKDVAFYLVGRGTVYLLGYEVILPKKVRDKESLPKGVKEFSEPEIENDDDDDDVLPKDFNSSSSETSPQKRPRSIKSGKKEKKMKSVEQVAPEKREVVEMVDDDNNNDDDEEDSDFCIGDDEFESSESEGNNGDESEEEVEVDESEIEDLVAEITTPELIPTSKKRKIISESQQALKRSKMNSPKKSSSPKKVKIVEVDEENEIVEEDNLKEISDEEETSSKEENSPKDDNISKKESTKGLSESDAVGSCNGMPETASKLEKENSAEKKKRKKKKKRGQETLNMQQNKSPSNKISHLKKLKNGLEVKDLKVGHGPIASRGKMVHVFYVGRLSDRTIFDSRLPGNKPFSFKMGTDQVLKGLDKGVEGMRAGGKRKIQVPANMAYGNKPPSGIPPNSNLHFIVDLQAVG